jgi:hypothetical protein
MPFTIMSWNIKQFQGDPVRTDVVAGMIRALDPDVFGIIEFLAKDVALSTISDGFDDYDFGMTDSRQAIEFLVGRKRGRFDQVLYTQRRDFAQADSSASASRAILPSTTCCSCTPTAASRKPSIGDGSGCSTGSGACAPR